MSELTLLTQHRQLFIALIDLIQ